jgi:hypothetical protein
MSREELEYFTSDAPAPAVGKPPAPMSREELAYYLE